MKKNYLNNKTIVITGASGGLGFEISKLLIEKYKCNIIGIARNEQKMLNSIERLGNNKCYFSYKLFDVSKKENWKKFYEYLVENSIKIDILINNAGFMLPFNKLENISGDVIDDIISTNLSSNITSIKTLLPLLKQSDCPTIINISSSAGICPVVGQCLYSATKFAVRGFTESLIQDYKNKIYIAGVYPGFIKTDIMSDFNLDKRSENLIKKIMMPKEKAAKKILKKISRKKKKIVIGFDGRFMNFFYRLFPSLTPSLIRSILKCSKLKLFNDIFDNK